MEYQGAWITMSHNIRLRFVRDSRGDYLEFDATNGKMKPIRCFSRIIDELNQQVWEADSSARAARAQKLIRELESLDV